MAFSVPCGRYALNVQYNLYNKKILNIFPYPYTTALVTPTALMPSTSDPKYQTPQPP